MLDGFRWDYFDLGLQLPAFEKIFHQGVRARGLTPAFPSVSYPNHYTLLTGLYVESHGFVGNEWYDVTTGKYYSPWYKELTPEDRSFMYAEAEPLWVSAVRQNKRVHMFHWFGCEVLIQGRQPTYCVEHNGLPSIADLQRDLDESLQLFLNDSTDLAAVYHEKIDDHGHRYGPNSSKLNSAILEVDEEFSRMLTKFAETGLENEVDVMIFSDHGMTSVSPSRVVNVSDVMPMSCVDAIVNGYGSQVYIWSKEDCLQEVYDALKDYSPHFTAFLKDDIPDRWRFKNHKRIPPLILVPKIGWYIETPNFGFFNYDTGPIKAEHGYDPVHSEMRGIFTAFGPSFVPGATADQLHNVDLYQIMCHILDIEPRSHNGTWSRVRHMITDVSGFPSSLAVAVSTAVACVLVTVCYCYTSDRRHY
ncbi:glycerophosphocholine cholinephosphodiesterase ENPP6-like [Haliotis rufescens]|uniref:glycerophosphocholine cholinephosphodiesterase ENPP6-like n=1 Tax=Haliotis rufescens TaxID=6454 RepID=UPI00201F8295|nr:glycerophosphocholine cholinephosphodiesterase ENPP6-like [Haliotis rufescens]